MKKLFALMFVFMFCISFTSAFEFDNGIKYENNDLDVIFENGYFFGIGEWFGLNEEIGKVELKSHKTIDEVLVVATGEDRLVMFYDFKNWSKYSNGLGEVSFINMKTNLEIDKDYYFAKAIYENVEITDYKETCSEQILINDSIEKNCVDEIIGTHLENRIIRWERLETNDIPEGNNRIGLFTKAKAGDHIDGIWTIAGKKIKKHSEWTAGLNADLVSYWTFDANSTIVNDSLGISNGTGNGGNGAALGIIGGGYQTTATTDNVNFNNSDSFNIDTQMSINFWYKGTDTTGNRWFVTKSAEPGDWQWTIQGSASANHLKVIAWDSGGTDMAVVDIATSTPYDNSWHMISAVFDNEVNLLLYLDGVNIGNDTTWVSSWDRVGTSAIRIGEYVDRDAKIGFYDEMGYWNRTLSSTEIVQLYNSGSAISFTDNFETLTATQSFPVDSFSTINPEVGLGCNFSSAIQNITSVKVDVYNTSSFLSYTNTDSSMNDVSFNKSWTPPSLDDGTYNWSCEGFGSLGADDKTSNRTFTINTQPNITYQEPTPVQSENLTIDNFRVKVNLTETFFQNITFNLYNSSDFNINSTTFTDGTRIFNYSSLGDGIYNYNVTTETTRGQQNHTPTREITLHTTPATIEITEPKGQISSFILGDNQTLSWNVTETGQNLTEHIKNCSYIYNSIETQVNLSDCLISNTTSFEYVFGINNLTFKVVEEFGIVTTNFTSWTYSFIENNATFNSTSQETAIESFILNMTTDINVLSISSILNYNGTEHISSASCDGNDCLLSNTIDISLVETGESELHDFFWNFTIFNGTGSVNILSTTRTQNVSRIHLEQCNATFTTKTLNFTTFDEQNLSRVSPYKFDGFFEFWVGGGTIKRNNSFAKNITEMNLCLEPNVTMKVDATIDYDETTNTSIYTSRFFYFDGFPINNVLQQIKMYLLKSTESTSFILKVQDENLLPVADALIEIHRFYPGEGDFRIVQIAKTDDNGKSIGFFQTETVDYKFIIKKDGETLLETGQQKVIPETSPFTLTFNTGEDLGEPWESQNDIVSLNSTLIWDSTSGNVNYIYVDNSGNFTLARLLVQKQSLTNTSAYTTICNDTSELSSSAITCTVGNTTGFYIASSFITRAGEGLDLQINFQIESFSSVSGLLGLFYGFFLIVIASFMFKFNEVAGIWAVTMTVFLVNIMGLIKFGSVFVSAIIGIALILTWVMER